MRCSDVQEQLVAAQDGELGPSAREQLEEHLATCERCRDWDEHLRSLHLDDTLHVPAEVREALESATRPRALVPTTPPAPPRPVRAAPPARTPRWPLALGAATALLGVGVAGGVAERADDRHAATPPTIPGEHFEKAAYHPASDPVPSRDTGALIPSGPATDGGAR